MKKKLGLLFMMLFSASLLFAQKTDVWDFGAVPLDASLYNNQLDVATINSWYPGTVTAGTSGNNFPVAFTSGILSWSGLTSDRLRTTNLGLSRFDQNIAGLASYTGRVYCNGAAAGAPGLATNRYMSMTLSENDEVTVIARCDTGTGALTFAYAADITVQKDVADITSVANTITEVKFVAKQAGVYRIYDQTQKLSVFRILRKAAVYVRLTGNIDVTQALGIPNGYSVLFTNPAGKSWNAPVNAGTYGIDLPAGYTYKLSLVNANGYIISNGESLAVSESTTNYNIAVQKVDLFTVSGSITGLGASELSKLSLTYSPNPAANKIFVPKPIITGSTYTVELEPNVEYTIAGQGVNDYSIPSNTITITGITAADVAFTAKPVYPITINVTGLNATQLSKLTLTFTNLNESGYVYSFPSYTGITLRDGIYTVAYGGLAGEPVEIKLISNLKVTGAATSKNLDFKPTEDTSAIPYDSEITVGTGKDFQTINEALKAVARMSPVNQPVTVLIDPGNYEEMIVIKNANITLKNASPTPSIALLNKGVDIDPNAVRITSYYGVGYNYFSQGTDNKWSAEALAVNKENGYTTYENVSGTTNASYWNATAVINANGFTAENIIFENSFNQYISQKESQDTLVQWTVGGKGVRPTTAGSTAVQAKSFVERAAAIGVPNNIQKVVLNNCRVVGRQDSFFGGSGARVVVYKGVMMGGTDYIFGGMDVVFYKSDLAMNTSEDNNDTSYITAAQQTTGRGYLMYECKVTSAIPGIETASSYRSKPGYFGRPWQATTSEVVFYNTTIETSNNPSFNGQLLIFPLGWNDSLNGSTRSPFMYEYGSVDSSAAPVSTSSRATWATTLSVPTLTDGTPITTFEFTKGGDNWDPIPALIANEALGTKTYQAKSAVNVYGYKSNIVISNVVSSTKVAVYSLNGALVKSFETTADAKFEMKAGVWIVVIQAADGQKAVKLMTY